MIKRTLEPAEKQGSEPYDDLQNSKEELGHFPDVKLSEGSEYRHDMPAYPNLSLSNNGADDSIKQQILEAAEAESIEENITDDDQQCFFEDQQLYYDNDNSEDEGLDIESLSSESEAPDEDIDYNKVYALHSFQASAEGQTSAIKNEPLSLLDDSHSYWWLIHNERRNSIGYLPAEIVELPQERLARLNKHKNAVISEIDATAEAILPARGKERQPKTPDEYGRYVSFRAPVYKSPPPESLEDIDLDKEDEKTQNPAQSSKYFAKADDFELYHQKYPRGVDSQKRFDENEAKQRWEQSEKEYLEDLQLELQKKNYKETIANLKEKEGIIESLLGPSVKSNKISSTADADADQALAHSNSISKDKLSEIRDNSPEKMDQVPSPENEENDASKVDKKRRFSFQSSSSDSTVSTSNVLSSHISQLDDSDEPDLLKSKAENGENNTNDTKAAFSTLDKDKLEISIPNKEGKHKLESPQDILTEKFISIEKTDLPTSSTDTDSLRPNSQSLYNNDDSESLKDSRTNSWNDWSPQDSADFLMLTSSLQLQEERKRRQMKPNERVTPIDDNITLLRDRQYSYPDPTNERLPWRTLYDQIDILFDKITSI